MEVSVPIRGLFYLTAYKLTEYRLLIPSGFRPHQGIILFNMMVANITVM